MVKVEERDAGRSYLLTPLPKTRTEMLNTVEMSGIDESDSSVPTDDEFV
jgi:hypothetical protein